MKNLFRHLPAIFILLFAGLGCSSVSTSLGTIESTKVKPENVYQSYQIDADKNGMNVVVTFRDGGAWEKTVDLDEPSKIEYNGKEMEQSAAGFLKGTTYEFYSKEIVPENEFVYTDATGKIFRNQINVLPIEIATQEIIFSRSRPNTIQFSRPVQQTENLTITLTSLEDMPDAGAANSKTKDATHSAFIYGELDESRTSITFSPNDLKKFTNGKAVLEIVVKGDVILQEANKVGGEINSVYETEADVKIVN
jgi:hypothetical protein